MRWAIVSDIHGNLPALDAVIVDIATAQVDGVLNLGDIVSGPLWPAETATRLMGLGWPTIRGNHERQVLQPAAQQGASDRYAAQHLAPAHRAWLQGLPATCWLAPDAFACHGTPASDLVYFLDTVTDDFGRDGSLGVRAATPDEAAQRAGDIAARLLLCGHTHQPRGLHLPDGRLVVNPGSVGVQAYDDDHPHRHFIETGSPQARYAIVERGADGWSAQWRQVAYDAEAAARQAESNGRSDWADALRTGRVGRMERDVLGPAP